MHLIKINKGYINLDNVSGIDVQDNLYIFKTVDSKEDISAVVADSQIELLQDHLDVYCRLKIQ